MNLLNKRALAALIATCLAPCAWTADQTQNPAGAHAKTVAADPSKPVLLAGLRPQPELVWQRTSPNGKALDGPVLYQILFRSSATPRHLPKIAPNFTLTDSLISEGNGFIAIGALSINSSGIVTFANGQTFPGTSTITSIATGAGLTGGGSTGNLLLNIALGGVTNPMLAANSVSNANIADGSLNPAKITGTAAILGSNSFIGNALRYRLTKIGIADDEG